MLRTLLIVLLLAPLSAAMARAEPAPTQPVETKKTRVVVIPVHDQIASPVLYIVRRGLKEAIETGANVVVLDMDTPGGSLATTFEILEALEKFPGHTLTFVNKDAISAGAFISAATHEIYFAPNGVIGAAAPVSGGGQDIDKTMKQKVVSYLKARVRSISEGKGGYRGEVISAMIDENYELKIGDRVLKRKDELLSLTAKEASETFGDPPQSLLAAGIASDIDALLARKYGAGNFEVRVLEMTWSEHVAQYLTAISPILLGLGMLALFIEFKTPGFGVFGIAGAVLLGTVFLSNYIAGLSGHEPLLVFALGIVMVIVEIFFLPGVVVMAVGGLALMLGALVWSMADLWPNEPMSFSGDIFFQPMVNVLLGCLIAVGLAVVLLRFLPRGWFWDRMILDAAINTAAQRVGAEAERGAASDNLVGRRGVAMTPLRPFGQVEIDGVRYEARVDVGSVEKGAAVEVVGRTDFSLVVQEVES